MSALSYHKLSLVRVLNSAPKGLYQPEINSEVPEIAGPTVYSLLAGLAKEGFVSVQKVTSRESPNGKPLYILTKEGKKDYRQFLRQHGFMEKNHVAETAEA